MTPPLHSQPHGDEVSKHDSSYFHLIPSKKNISEWDPHVHGVGVGKHNCSVHTGTFHAVLCKGLYKALKQEALQSP